MTADPPTPARRLAEAVAGAVADLKAGGSIGAHADSLRRLIADFGAAPNDNAEFELVEALRSALRARGLTMPSMDKFPPSVAAFFEAVDESFAEPGPLDLESVADRLERAAAKAFGGRTITELRAEALRDQIRREVSESLAATLRAQGLTPAVDMNDEDDDDLEEAHRAT